MDTKERNYLLSLYLLILCLLGVSSYLFFNGFVFSSLMCILWSCLYLLAIIFVNKISDCYIICTNKKYCCFYLRGKTYEDIHILVGKLKRMEKFSIVNLTVVVTAIIAGVKFIVFGYNKTINLDFTYVKENQNGDFFYSSIIIIMMSLYIFFTKECVVTSFRKVLYERNIIF